MPSRTRAFEARQAVAVLYGGARLTLNERPHDWPYRLVIDFPDALSLERAVNSGRADFALADETVAVVLQAAPGEESG